MGCHRLGHVAGQRPSHHPVCPRPASQIVEGAAQSVDCEQMERKTPGEGQTIQLPCPSAVHALRIVVRRQGRLAIGGCANRLATIGSGLPEVASMLSTGASASCVESVSSGGASPMFQSLLRRSVHGSSPSRDTITQVSSRILMPDPYSNCKKSSAPSWQHSRGASATPAGSGQSRTVRCIDLNPPRAREFAVTSPVRYQGSSD